MSDTQDTAIVESLLAAKLTLSLKAIQYAKDACWNDLPANEKLRYQRLAEQAVKEEMRKA